MDVAPVIIALSSAAITLSLVAAFAAGWYAGRRGHTRPAAAAPKEEEPPAAARISLADLRARMRRLEAIAAGIDV